MNKIVISYLKYLLPYLNAFLISLIAVNGEVMLGISVMISYTPIPSSTYPYNFSIVSNVEFEDFFEKPWFCKNSLI